MGKFKIFLAIFIVLVLGAVLLLALKPFSQKAAKTDLPLKKLNETVQEPAQEVPQTNPFEEVKTNPFKDVKTNPFDI